MTEINYERSDAGQSAPRTLEQFAPLIHKYAYKFSKRALTLNKSWEVEDIKQELAVVFLLCVKKYDPEKGGSFMNYVISAWYNEINRLLKKDQQNIECGHTVRATAWSEDDANESFSLLDNIASSEATPEQVLEGYQSVNRILDKLSAPARTLVETLVNPPDSVVKEFDRQYRGRFHRTGESGTTRAHHHLNLAFLTSLFEIPAIWARSLSVEIREACNDTIIGK